MRLKIAAGWTNTGGKAARDKSSAVCGLLYSCCWCFPFPEAVLVGLWYVSTELERQPRSSMFLSCLLKYIEEEDWRLCTSWLSHQNLPAPSCLSGLYHPSLSDIDAVSHRAMWWGKQRFRCCCPGRETVLWPVCLLTGCRPGCASDSLSIGKNQMQPWTHKGWQL